MRSTIFFLMLCCSSSAFSQGTWTQVSNFGGTARAAAVAFSVGGKGYVGTGGGISSSTWTNDFWAYDTLSNSWSQKANFAGTQRVNAVGFAIGNKGYIGTGFDNVNGETNDFWEYDPTGNTWTQKANVGGIPRSEAIGFSIGNKGYIGTGWNNSSGAMQDFWEYDPSLDLWTQKAIFGGGLLIDAMAFSSDFFHKGYVCGGEVGAGWFTDSLWEYDPLADAWTKKSSLPGKPRDEGAAFSFQTKGYVLLGDSEFVTCYRDIWEYDMASDSWCRKADFPGTSSQMPVAFAIGNSGFCGTGYDCSGIPHRAFWKFIPGSGCNNVGTQEISNKEQIFLTPNPSRGKFSVCFTGWNERKAEIEIFNSLGERVCQLHTIVKENDSNFPVDMSGQPQGIYFVLVRSGSCSLTKKIMVER